ncbi:hypothetical protein TYRP_014669 [Tyrophagus putrescentiae]|nr:hypothetical protein TYRP_014669 [Tyrophagus putrescentiae]
MQSGFAARRTPRTVSKVYGRYFQCISVALEQAGVSPNRSFDLVSVCGQMHGVVLWNDQTLFNDESQLNYATISDNYDWTDGRCTKNFLASLPPPDCHTDVVSTGYAVATIFWLAKHEPQYLKQFNRAATIMDFFNVVLCKLKEPSISLQNANNWGYFNTEKQAWNAELLKANGFPVNLLPTVVPLNTVVSRTANFAPIADDIPVMVSYGDLQAVLTLALLNNEDALVLNMGTSIQLVRFEPTGFSPPRKSTSPKPSVDYMPYDASRYLAVAAGLNGGNVLRSYAAYLQDIVRQLTGLQMTEAEVWTKLASIPRLFGERHQPESDFQLTGVRFELPRLARLTRALCASLLENIFAMMALSEEECALTKTIVCTGNVMARNEGVRAGVEVHFLDECDADVGSALFAYRQYTAI